jgi:hypothetical protein
LINHALLGKDGSRENPAARGGGPFGNENKELMKRAELLDKDL